MTDPLASARLKYKRAVEHLEALDVEVRRFADYDLERIRAERDPESIEPIHPVWLADLPTGSHAFPDKAQYRTGFLPSRFGVILGDFLSNLRAALDHAANGVAGDAATVYTKFPIYAKTQKAKDIAKDLAGVPGPCWTAILKMQPYHGTRRGKRLLLLASLCNLDKHKVLHGATFLVYEAVWTFGDETQAITKTFVERGVLGDKAEVRIVFLGPDHAPQVEGGAPYRIYFARSSSHEAAATRTDLRLLLEEVRGIITEIGNIARPAV